jgi:hypothetical protein
MGNDEEVLNLAGISHQTIASLPRYAVTRFVKRLEVTPDTSVLMRV